MQHQNQTAFLFADRTEVRNPQHIYIKEPPIGNKIHLICERGLFVLERGPTLWLGLSCTHAGSGGIVVYDGVPDEEGFFPEPPAAPQLFNVAGDLIQRFDRGISYRDAKGNHIDIEEAQQAFINHAMAMSSRNGRRVAYANPAAMGMWIYSAGLHHGLTVEAVGEMQGTASIMSFTWLKQKERK